jgi:hypothetical protein
MIRKVKILQSLSSQESVQVLTFEMVCAGGVRERGAA